MADGEIVNIYNRTQQVLSVTRNGVERKLLPGDNYLPEGWVRFAKSQNPRMGSQDYGSGKAEYLVGVKVDLRLGQMQKDPTDDIEPGKEHYSIERIDRQTVPELERRTGAKVERGVIPANDRPSRSAPIGGFGGATEGLTFRDEHRDSTGVATA